MGTSFDVILTAGALIIGVLMLLGKGDFFLNDKNADSRNKEYDMKKTQRGFGVSLVVVGIATGVSAFLQTTVSYVIYIIVVAIAFGGGVFYMKKYCKK